MVLAKLVFCRPSFSTFITGRTDVPGSIGNISLDKDSTNIFSFFQLVRCTYFRKHTAAFQTHTPEALFNSISDTTDSLDQHTIWLSKIRTAVHQRIDNVNNSMPSAEALRLHWRRCLWVIGMWSVLHLMTWTCLIIKTRTATNNYVYIIIHMTY